MHKAKQWLAHRMGMAFRLGIIFGAGYSWARKFQFWANDSAQKKPKNWTTLENGVHVPIRKGQTKERAVIAFLNKVKRENKHLRIKNKQEFAILMGAFADQYRKKFKGREGRMCCVYTSSGLYVFTNLGFTQYPDFHTKVSGEDPEMLILIERMLTNDNF